MTHTGYPAGMALPHPVVHTLAATVFATFTASQQTWTVAMNGAAQFTEIGPAVAAAADGDVILVEPGNYAPFAVRGKGVTIVGRSAGVFQSGFGPGPAVPPITIENLAPHQRVTVLALHVFNSLTPEATVVVRNCAGPVWVESMFADSYGATTLLVEDSDDVVLVDFFGQTNAGFTLPDGTPLRRPGARFVASSVSGYGCTFTGSHGVLQGNLFPSANAPARGGDGIEVVGSRVRLSGGRIGGGSGNGWFNGTCLVGAGGGDGAVLASQGGAPPELALRDVAVSGGSPAFQTCGPPTFPGQPWRLLAGQLVLQSGGARLLTGDPGVFAPGTLDLELEGEPNDAAFVFAGFPAATTQVLGLPLHLASPAIALGLATLGPNGQATLPVAVPPLGAGAPPVRLVFQSLVIGAGAVFATNPTALLVR